jgi:hypothetical protein
MKFKPFDIIYWKGGKVAHHPESIWLYLGYDEKDWGSGIVIIIDLLDTKTLNSNQPLRRLSDQYLPFRYGRVIKMSDDPRIWNNLKNRAKKLIKIIFEYTVWSFKR